MSVTRVYPRRIRPDAGERLRRFVTPRVSRIQIARAAGVSPQYLSQIVLGQCGPSRTVAEAAIALGVPSAVFYDNETTRVPAE